MDVAREVTRTTYRRQPSSRVRRAPFVLGLEIAVRVRDVEQGSEKSELRVQLRVTVLLLHVIAAPVDGALVAVVC
jgi:hypothetical protein